MIETSNQYGLTFLKSLQCKEEFSGIEHICPRLDGTVWIAQIEKVSLIDKDGNQLRIAEEASKPISVFPDGKLLATRKSRTIIKICEDGSSTIFAEFKAHVHGIHIGQRSVLVALWDYKVEPQHGYIARLDFDGREQQCIKQRPNGTPLCIMPKYVIENGDDVWLTDTDADRGKVLVIDGTGRYKFSYDGRDCRDVQLGGIAADQFCSVAVAYYDFVQLRNSIHIVSQIGDFMRKIMTAQYNIECPLALAFDDGGRLWVGELGVGTVHILSDKEQGV